MGVDVCIEVHGVKISPIDLCKAAGDLAEKIGSEQFWIKPEEDQHCLELTEEGAIRVNTLWRYYAPGYERGPWPEIRYTLLWLMKRFPEGLVCYWGDCDGIDLNSPVTVEFLDKMDDYFLNKGHEPYNQGFKGIFSLKDWECDFCLKVMSNHGGGAGVEFLQCHGCSQKFIVKDDKLNPLAEKEDFFAGNDRLRKEENESINQR